MMSGGESIDTQQCTCAHYVHILWPRGRLRSCDKSMLSAHLRAGVRESHPHAFCVLTTLYCTRTRNKKSDQVRSVKYCALLKHVPTSRGSAAASLAQGPDTSPDTTLHTRCWPHPARYTSQSTRNGLRSPPTRAGDLPTEGHDLTRSAEMDSTHTPKHAHLARRTSHVAS